MLLSAPSDPIPWHVTAFEFLLRCTFVSVNVLDDSLCVVPSTVHRNVTLIPTDPTIAHTKLTFFPSSTVCEVKLTRRSALREKNLEIHTINF